ncbi:MAG TPA: response regulator [Thermoanaerobaculia bacterium]
MILFIDNEEARIRSWVDELNEEGFQVEVLSSADAARHALDAADPPQCVVLDLMIPADGEVPDRETAYGTRTGLWLLQRFRKIHGQVPVVVLTNVDDPGVEEAVISLAAVYRRKRDCGPARLVELIRLLTSGTG